MNQITDKKINNNLLLDVRNKDEIDSVRFNNNNNEYRTILYIPSNLIKYNLEFLNEHFREYENIYIICKSGARSKKIKDKYFIQHENVHVNSKHFESLDKSNIHKSQGIHLSIIRKIQIISGSIIILLFSFLLFYNDAKYAFLLFGIVMVYVGISGNCFMSSILSKDDI
jgi:hypothetical protein